MTTVNDKIMYRKIKAYCSERHIRNYYDFLFSVEESDPKLYQWATDEAHIRDRTQTIKDLIEPPKLQRTYSEPLDMLRDVGVPFDDDGTPLGIGD